MATVTKTLHPLPFHHLEPKRFEDLVRQLAYDFRPWRQLEATGTGGDDASFDIRGWEVVGAPPEPDTEEHEEKAEQPAAEKDRLWLIQCKREAEIGPTKLAKYVDDIPEEEAKKLYGVIIAASCTLSKKARDKFREHCAARGFQEYYLWSRSELEDLLFLPKNDGLLFAYFGFSLTLRRRAAASKLRARLAAKRKVIRAFESNRYIGRQILLVDVNADYPYRYPDKEPLEQVNWRFANATEIYERGIKLEMFKYSAYIDADFTHFDVAPFADHSTHVSEFFWTTKEEDELIRARVEEVDAFMKTLDQDRRAICHGTGYLPFERIIEIDKDGDQLTRCPIIYVEYEKPGLVGLGIQAMISCASYLSETDDGKATMKKFSEQEIEVFTDDERRVQIFPEHMRKKVF